MRISFRLIIWLLLVSAGVAFGFSYAQIRKERIRLREELSRRAIILAESLQESVSPILQSGSTKKLKKLMGKFGNREKLIGIAVYDDKGILLVETPGLSSRVSLSQEQVMEVITRNEPVSRFEIQDGKAIHLYIVPLSQEEIILGALAVFHNASYIDEMVKGMWNYNFIRLLILSVFITFTTLFIVRISITQPLSQFVKWLREVRTGQMFNPVNMPRGDILGPLVDEVAELAKSLAQARKRAEEEARLRLSAESIWTAERLKEFIRGELGERRLYVVSNREPYMHIYKGRKIECIVPAGGVVTAIDPIMRACNGLWIAHGSGDADAESSDENGKLLVPPDEQSYTLKRVWLSKEEEEGYYYGFSNEGLWPLCHITHNRPTFRLDDWIDYQRVNEKFCESLLDEIKEEEKPLILIQDYHFALLPLLVKSKKPDARVAIFWHIPWPNPEVFGICPWKNEILLGMLGADLIGFHTQFYCNNFLETIDRFLECKINWNEFSIERRGHITLLKAFPISVEFSGLASEEEGVKFDPALRESLLKELGISVKYLGVGVDRIDYTKGIGERFRAIERFFQKYPDFIGQFSFVELGAPSRTQIQKYYELIEEVEETAEKINWKFQKRGWKPIIFLKGHHSHKEIYRYYRAADLCMVTSLHDGMNLVAKEFIASRSDEDGVLILSQFTGAAVELRDALLVNPYDIEEMGETIHTALTMEPEERARRMKALREIVKERNVYRWAGNLVSTLMRVRVRENFVEEKKE